MGSIRPDVDTRMGYISTEITPGHSEANLKWAITSSEAILLHLPSQDPRLRDAVLKEGWCKWEMASHQKKEHIFLSRGGQLLTDLSWHSDVTVLPRSICYTWKDWRIGKGAKQTSQILLYQRLSVWAWGCMRVCMCVHIHTCARTQERHRAGQGRQYCPGIFNVILDGFCLEDDKCAAFSLAFLFIFVCLRLY